MGVLQRILTHRKSFDSVLQRYVGSVLDEPMFLGLRAGLETAGLKGVPRSTLERSMPDLLGNVLEAKDAAYLAYRLAGNMTRLRRGEPTPPWQYQPAAEAAVVQVLQLLRWPNRNKKPGFQVSMLILSGYAAGKTLKNFWSYELCRYVSTRIFGFSSRRGAKPYHQPHDLVRLYAAVEIDPDRSVSEPKYSRLIPRGELAKINQHRIGLRLTKNQPDAEYRCPIDFRGNCSLCPLGYTPSETKRHCPLAVRPQTIEIRRCPSCRNDEAAFDPAVSVRVCDLCAEAQRMRPV